MLGGPHRNITTTAIVAVLLLASCGRAPAAPPSDVRDIRDTQPDEAPDQHDDEAARNDLHIAEAAFETDGDLDLDQPTQRELLELVVDAFAYTVTALDQGAYDPDLLGTYYAGDELDAVLAGFERFAEDGLRQIADGTTVEFVRTTAATVAGAATGAADEVDPPGATVLLCVREGPDAGIVDRDTGEYVFTLDDPHRAVAFHLAAQNSTAWTDWRIVDSEPATDLACP